MFCSLSSLLTSKERKLSRQNTCSCFVSASWLAGRASFCCHNFYPLFTHKLTPKNCSTQKSASVPRGKNRQSSVICCSLLSAFLSTGGVKVHRAWSALLRRLWTLAHLPVQRGWEEGREKEDSGIVLLLTVLSFSLGYCQQYCSLFFFSLFWLFPSLSLSFSLFQQSTTRDCLSESESDLHRLSLS